MKKATLILLGIVIIAGGVYMYLHNRKGNSSETPQTQTSEIPVQNIVARPDWKITFTKEPGWQMQNPQSGTILLRQTSGENTGDVITLSYMTATTSVYEFDAKFGPTQYVYDEKAKTWMLAAHEDDSRGGVTVPTAPATPVMHTKGGQPIFLSTGRWKTYFIMLPQNNVIKANITGSGATDALDRLVQTISYTPIGQ